MDLDIGIWFFYDEDGNYIRRNWLGLKKQVLAEYRFQLL